MATVLTSVNPKVAWEMYGRAAPIHLASPSTSVKEIRTVDHNNGFISVFVVYNRGDLYMAHKVPKITWLEIINVLFDPSQSVNKTVSSRIFTKSATWDWGSVAPESE